MSIPALGAGPMMAMSLGINMMSSLMQYSAQKEAVQRQNAVAQANAEAAARDAYLKQMQENIRLEQERESAIQESVNLNIERKQRQGQAVAQGEGSGLSLSQLLADFERQEGRYRNILARDLSNKADQTMINKKSHVATGNSRINQAESQLQPEPSLLSTGLQIAGAGLGTYTNLAGPMSFKGSSPIGPARNLFQGEELPNNSFQITNPITGR